ncbi:hypothetical protein D210916BOD24_29550 [Alteromonas sp. D210916BOD_24]|uniref:hypothetical protein n=1 Tax=Alteromonas sp. D210916BOD_24 TaxID=3157618 RepID=UPI00399CF093
MSIAGYVKRFWRFHSLIVGAMGICVFTLGCAVQEPAPYEGTWIVTKAYQPGISALSLADAEHYLGRSVTYTSTSAKLDQIQCESPIYDSTTLSNNEFYHHFNASPQALGFSDDSITEVTLSCDNGSENLGSTLVLQEDTLAYTVIDGTFLKLEKTL